MFYLFFPFLSSSYNSLEYLYACADLANTRSRFYFRKSIGEMNSVHKDSTRSSRYIKKNQNPFLTFVKM